MARFGGDLNGAVDGSGPADNIATIIAEQLVGFRGSR
jgi:hypothetical protein